MIEDSMKIEKGIGKGKSIPQDDFGMWISDILRQKENEQTEEQDERETG